MFDEPIFFLFQDLQCKQSDIICYIYIIRCLKKSRRGGGGGRGFSYNGMKCFIKHKHKLYPHYEKYPLQSNKKLYKEYRNMLTRLLRRTERTYYDRLLIDNIDNLKKTWSIIINDVINEKKKAPQAVNLSSMVIMSLTTSPLLKILIKIL